MRRLAVDYAFAYDRLAPFFSGHPADTASWTRAIAAAQAHPRRRSDITRVIAAQQARRGAPAESRAAAARLEDPSAVAVVTGQQAGLFGGPLFTVLKAVTAIGAAARITREHGVPAIPVFWIDAEDHDWDEVRASAVLDGDLALRSVEAAPPDGAGERPVGSLAWDARITGTVTSLVDALPVTEFTPWITGILEQAYTPGASVADSFGRLLEQVLGVHGLVVYDASDPAAKPLVAELFARELEHAGRTSLLAARAGADLVGRGYHMQVTPQADAAALVEIAAGRRHIRREGDAFLVGTDRREGRDALVARARQQPEAFSPNVLLRPLVQDTLFPTACYVAGPNELAYLAQLGGVYESFGIPMPLMLTRATATLVDAAGLRFLTRHALPFEALQAQNEHALNELLTTLLPPDVDQALAAARNAIAERMAAVIAAMPLVDPTLEGKARSVVGRMEHELDTLRGKILQAAKRKDETLRRQFTHAQAQAFPQGHPQERTVGGIGFLNRYGPALVTRLLAEMPLDGTTHWVISV